MGRGRRGSHGSFRGLFAHGAAGRADARAGPRSGPRAAVSVVGMPDEPQPGPDDDFQEMLRKLLSGEGQIDPSQLAGAAGLPNDPAFVANLMSQLQRAAQNGGDGIDFTVTAERAAAIAREGEQPLDPATAQAAAQAFQVAALWLDEVTTVAEPHLDAERLHPRAVGEGDGTRVVADRRARRVEHRDRPHRGDRPARARGAEAHARRRLEGHARGRWRALRDPARPGRRTAREGGRVRR